MIDVQNLRPEINIPLSRVGIKNIKKCVRVKRKDRIVILTLTINAFVDLPSNRKGVHMSRSTEIINSILEDVTSKPTTSLEDLSAEIAKKLLERHEYASKAEVEMIGDYTYERETPITHQKVHETCKLIANATAYKNGKVSKMIGIKVLGATVCPCTQQMMRDYIKSLLEENNLPTTILEKIPIATHNQRTVTKILLEIPERYEVEAEDLIRIAEDCMSAPTLEVLKRKDEFELVKKAHFRPMFVEDVARCVGKTLVNKFDFLPDDCRVYISVESEESIHKHNAFTELDITLGKLRRYAQNFNS